MSKLEQHDSELWCLLKSGDEAAYATLFRKYYNPMVRYGKSLTTLHNVVPDCVQEVFIEVWTYRSNLAIPDSIKAYLLAGVRKRIVRHLERDHIFKNKTGLQDLEFIMDFTALDKMILDEETQYRVSLLNKMVNELPSRQKEVLHLRYHHGLGIDQIADLMQINTQSTSNLIHRAISHLRGECAKYISLVTMLLLLS